MTQRFVVVSYTVHQSELIHERVIYFVSVSEPIRLIRFPYVCRTRRYRICTVPRLCSLLLSDPTIVRINSVFFIRVTKWDFACCVNKNRAVMLLLKRIRVDLETELQMYLIVQRNRNSAKAKISYYPSWRRMCVNYPKNRSLKKLQKWKIQMKQLI